MVTKKFAIFGVSTIFILFMLFLFFLSSDIDNGPVPPDSEEREIFTRAFNGETRAVCAIRPIEGQENHQKGDIFVSNGSINLNFESNDEKGYMLMTAEGDLHIWMEEAGEGILLSADFITEGEVDYGEERVFMNTLLSDYFADLNEEGGLLCREEDFDENLMYIPGNVEFISVSDGLIPH